MVSFQARQAHMAKAVKYALQKLGLEVNLF